MSFYNSQKKSNIEWSFVPSARHDPDNRELSFSLCWKTSKTYGIKQYIFKQNFKSKIYTPIIDSVDLLRSPDQQSPDEVLGLGGDLRERLLSKLPVTAGHVLKGLQVVFSSEGGQPTQPVQQSIEIAHYSMI